jgi:hypothetical protein
VTLSATKLFAFDSDKLGADNSRSWMKSPTR